MTLLFTVPGAYIMEAIAQMTDGKLSVYREGAEIVRVSGPVDNIITRITHVVKAGIQIKNVSTLVHEEDVNVNF